LCRDFGLTTVAASVVVTIATVPPSLWTQSACDAWGANHLLALVVGGAGLVAVSRFVGPTQSLGVRLASLGAVGGLAAAAYLAAEPACIGGPYVHIDPWLQEVWLSRISEALSLWDNVEHDPVRFVVPLVVPLVVGVWALARRARRLPDPGGTELLLTVCLFLSVPLGLWQVRALSYTSLFTVVLAAHLGARVAGRLSRADRTPIAIGLIVAAVLLTNDVSVSLVSSVVAPPATEQAAETTPPPDGGGAGYEGCSGLSEYAGLAELQPTLIAAEVDIAPYVLLSSQHQVVGANYHRAVRGVRDTFRILTAEPDAARAVVAERDVGMILLCETGGSAVTARMFPDGLAARLRRGEVPSWLAPVDVGDDALLAFRVLDPPAS
ncbi:MAG: hypothetical protein OEY23_17920, partial [Acidimicrobiia bacterium]|nr:hypothetical protein [Acidimicrobiia bacterium]